MYKTAEDRPLKEFFSFYSITVSEVSTVRGSILNNPPENGVLSLWLEEAGNICARRHLRLTGLINKPLALSNDESIATAN